MINIKRRSVLAAPALLLPKPAVAQLASSMAGTGGAAPAPSAIYVTTVTSTTAATTTTFSSVSLGTPSAFRRISVIILIRNATGLITISGVTIGGVTATIYQNWTSGSGQSIALADAMVPTGATGNIVVTTNINVQEVVLSVYRLLSFYPDNWGGISAGASDTADTVYCDPASGNVVLSGAVYFAGSATIALTGDITTTDYSGSNLGTGNVCYAGGNANPGTVGTDEGVTSTITGGVSSSQAVGTFTYNPVNPAGASGSAWTPSNMYGVRGWFKGDTLSGTNGSSIGTWTDATSFGNNATQSGAGKPTLVTSGLNSMNVANFAKASSQFMNMPASYGAKWGAGGIAWVSISTSASGSVIGPPFFMGGSGGTSYFPFSDGNIYYDAGTNGRPNMGTPAGSAIASWCIFYSDYDGNIITARFNGSSQFSGTHTTKWNPSAGGLIGHDGSTDYFDGKIAEIVVIRQIEGYLAWKWGIQSVLPGGHPYKSAAPTN